MVHSKIPVHATVVSKENHSVVLMGKRNSGKTSLAYCLLESGWNLVTDTVCLISGNENKFEVESFTNSKNLYFKYPTIFPELNNHEYGIEEFSPKHNEIRLIVDVDLIFRGCFQNKGELHKFIFPQLTEQKKSQLFELSAGEAFSIFKQDAWNLHHENYDFTDEDETFIRHLFEQVKCFRMNIGSDWRYFMDGIFKIDSIFKTEILLK